MGSGGRVTSRRDVVPTLGALVRDATAGRSPATVVVTGASGAGKTHVLEGLLPELTVPVRRVSAQSTSLHTPYDVACRLLDLTLPEPVPADSTERLLARLDELAATGPQVLVIDDAHRADAASLAVLDAVAGAAPDLRLALVLTRQPLPERALLSRLLERPGCLELEIPGLDALDLDVLVHEHAGRWPGPRLRALLTGLDPLQALTLLDDLGPELVASRDTVEAPAHPRATLAGGAVADRAARLEGAPREAARALAVLGAAATMEDLAALVGTDQVALVEPVSSLLDAGVVAFDDLGRVAFTHDAWRDAVYAEIPVPLRSVLHAAAADRVGASEQPHHLMSAGASGSDVLAVLARAADGLAHAPAVEADLLDGVAEAITDSDQAAELAARRARALALSGQFRRADEVARAALPGARDPAVFAELRRVTIFSLTTRADVPAVLSVLDETLQLPVPERSRRVLTDHRAYLGILGGTAPVPELPAVADPLTLTVTGLVAEAARTYLLGELSTALEYAWEAARRIGTPGVDRNEGASAEVWPPIVELSLHGPEAAVLALREVERLRDARGSAWQTASHQGLAGSIDLTAGRLTDAAATLDSALELAASTELGWISHAVGSRALVDVLCGDLTAAETRLDRWDADPRPLQLGMPQPARARIALLESQRRYAAAAELARATWRHAVRMRLRPWMVTVAPELCRVAVRAADPTLLEAVAAGLGDVPQPSAPAAVPARALSSALLGDPDRLAAAAGTAAEQAHAVGEGYVELMAREEAAVATALYGDRKAARARGAEALELAAACGADGSAARIAGRLRAAGVRMGSSASRTRPTSGWESLTPTEQLVVEQVAAGRSGPEIAQRLNISPRTVQTHVSHVLTKLGLTNRIELAALAASRIA